MQLSPKALPIKRDFLYLVSFIFLIPYYLLIGFSQLAIITSLVMTGLVVYSLLKPLAGGYTLIGVLSGLTCGMLLFGFSVMSLTAAMLVLPVVFLVLGVLAEK